MEQIVKEALDKARLTEGGWGKMKDAYGEVLALDSTNIEAK